MEQPCLTPNRLPYPSGISAQDQLPILKESARLFLARAQNPQTSEEDLHKTFYLRYASQVLWSPYSPQPIRIGNCALFALNAELDQFITQDKNILSRFFAYMSTFFYFKVDLRESAELQISNLIARVKRIEATDEMKFPYSASLLNAVNLDHAIQLLRSSQQAYLKLQNLIENQFHFEFEDPREGNLFSLGLPESMVQLVINKGESFYDAQNGQIRVIMSHSQMQELSHVSSGFIFN